MLSLTDIQEILRIPPSPWFEPTLANYVALITGTLKTAAGNLDVAFMRGATAGLAEHAGFWPLTRLIDRHHPARSELVPMAGNRRAFAQAAWRHFLFGFVLGELERRLNAQGEFEPLEGVPVSSNGHGGLPPVQSGE